MRFQVLFHEMERKGTQFKGHRSDAMSEDPKIITSTDLLFKLVV